MMNGLCPVLLLSLFVLGSCENVVFNINLDDQPADFPHYWEECVGSGHMLLTSRVDWREHLAMVRRDIGFKRIRGHGLLDDDMSTSLGPNVNSYINVDLLVDYLIELGMRPILELSFMPNWLSSHPTDKGGKTVCHYVGNINPPKDYQLWGNMIAQLGEHLVGRYGEETVSEFLFEVWNEPGVAPTFWTGTQADYFKLFNYTSRALKGVSEKIQVGGPATDCCPCWIQDFEKFNKEHKIAYDFISTHCYAGGRTDFGNATKLGHTIAHAKSLISSPKIPFVITEFSSNYIQGDEGKAIAGIMHDLPAEAAFLVSLISQPGTGAAQVLSYWTFSDVFAEPGFPSHNISFHGTFGLTNIFGVPKPSYRALEMLHTGGEQRLPVYGASTIDLQSDTCHCLPLLNSTHLNLFLHNYAMPGAPIEACNADIRLSGLGFPHKSASGAILRRIDEDHTNPRGYWIKEMGMFSGYPTIQQKKQLKKASEISTSPVSGDVTGPTTLEFKRVSVPTQAVAVLSVPLFS
eukprot:TRINITY_DN62337_c0_g1_i2.p1 TRINITY_DN62337_c0_g1~~TRINITY_DN62337_c0_g1_i2.p1  ORF type:complete len:518 (+),score=48.43 TRINITY_DN62337_c0_g1_i2:14-1567(+)